MKLSRRVALVTGCSSGFGLLIAVELARAGATVVATMRNLEKRHALEAAAREAGVRVEIDRLDVTDVSSIEAAVSGALQRHGRIDILVNNAGYALGGFVEDVSLPELRAQLETNFFGVAAVTKAVLPAMRAQGWGRVITMSSLAGQFGAPGLGAYNAAKWAVEGWSEALRFEMLPHDVYVSLIEPGFYNTQIFDANRHLAARATDPASPNAGISRRLVDDVEETLRNSRADPSEVARLVVRVAAERRPRLRYPAGRGAALAIRFAPLLPPAWLETLRLSMLRRRGLIGP